MKTTTKILSLLATTLALSSGTMIATEEKVDCFNNVDGNGCYNNGQSGCQKSGSSTRYIPHPDDPDPAGTNVPNGSCGFVRNANGSVSSCGQSLAKQHDPEKCKKCGEVNT